MAQPILSKAEAELYDRQIRLWGIESQEKLRAANILLIGVQGLGSEIAKNILLCGINSLTILDDATVTEEKITKNFLLDRNSIGKNMAQSVLLKAQSLNPLVKIVVDTNNISVKQKEYFDSFTMIVATDLKSEDILKLDNICREKKIKFICGNVYGMFGYSILDLQEHEFLEEKVSLPPKKRTHEGKPLAQSLEKIITKVQRKIVYPNLKQVLVPTVPVSPKKTLKRRNILYYLVLVLNEFRDAVGRYPLYTERKEDLKKLKELKDSVAKRFELNSEKFNDNLLNVIFGEIPPICSILGGIIAQEVIKAVSCKEVPVHNLFLLDPYTFSGSEELICH
ncbi:SUMO-activating enzyme subunit 1 [Agrilus planipennis]|uniref:SUMO-activating enzyme subunit 1 n=1 Tax=Agrilus planipennis TaxID=224129 RepID=A0A1W4XJ21_AGRPL|nr:SUMO-activating enzyme subunit 1 [Agrilus planipennis]